MPPQIEIGEVSIDDYFQVKKEDSGLPITGLQVFEFFNLLFLSSERPLNNYIYSSIITQCWAAPDRLTWRWWSRKRK